MNFEEFKNRVKILEPLITKEYRKKYIDTFVDTNCEYYDDIRNLKLFSDGWCYTRYLWDCLKEPCQINWSDIVLYQNCLGSVLVFWDIHSCERILIPDYWKFPKNACLELNFDDLCNNKEFFPEDLYIFDASFKWTIVFTHETDRKEQPLFLKSGVILENRLLEV